MKALVIVDWDNLRDSLDLIGFISSSDLLSPALKAKALEFAEAKRARVESMEVYATPLGLGNPKAQENWLRAGYDLHPTPADAETSKQELYAGILSSCFRDPVDLILLMTGDRDFSPLLRRLESAGAECHVWRAQLHDHQSHQTLESIPQLLRLPRAIRTTAVSITQAAPAFEGVVKLIELEITKRIQQQLLGSARKYSTPHTVQEVFDRLVGKLYAASFRPATILAWIDQSRHWNGSETVAKRLADRMGCKVATIEIREEGERREVLSLPDFEHAPQILVVDDAAFSGRTLQMLVAEISSRHPTIQFKTAVLSAKEPVVEAVDFFGDTHLTDDVLFPWGWARTVDKFYDLLRQLGISDKRWLLRSGIGEISRAVISDNILSTVDVLSFDNMPAQADAAILDVARRERDELLYILHGEVKISIVDTTGDFQSSEFLFLPRVVPYQLHLQPGSLVLRVHFNVLLSKD